MMDDDARLLLADARNNTSCVTNQRYYHGLEELRLAQRGDFEGRLTSTEPKPSRPGDGCRKLNRAQRTDIVLSDEGAIELAARYKVDVTTIYYLWRRARGEVEVPPR